MKCAQRNKLFTSRFFGNKFKLVLKLLSFQFSSPLENLQVKIAVWLVAKVVAHLHQERVEKAADQKAVMTEAPLKKEVIPAHTLHEHFQVDKMEVLHIAVADIIPETYTHPKAQLKIIIQSPMEATLMGKLYLLNEASLSYK